jgi:hypothetical protein
MAVSIGDNGHLGDCNRYGRQLRVCAELCRRIRQNDYFDNLTGPTTFSIWETPSIDGCYNFHSTYYRDGHPISDAELSRLFKMAERNRKNDLQYLCRLMSKYLLCWWT